MAGSRRRNRRHWPDYLLARQRTGGLYYYWKHPITKQEYGLGYDFAEAASQAREANAALAAERAPKARLVDRLKGRDTKTVAAWLDVFETILERRKGKGGKERSANTRRTDKSRAKMLREHFGPDKLIAATTTEDCSKLLERLEDEGKARMAQSMHSMMIDCFNEAIAKGWLKLGENPAAVLKAPQPVVKRARLNLEQFQRILDRAGKHAEPWLKTALMLAILTGQRVGDISAMRFDDVRADEHGNTYLHVIQDKEGHPIRIPVDLFLPAWPGTTVGSVIKEARTRGIVGAQYICHHQVSVGFAKTGEQVHEQTLSKNFTALLRDEFDEGAREREWPTKTPPTFHEIRSLAKRLYDKVGVNTMLLLGHKSTDAAAIYADTRGEWWTVPLPNKAAS